MTAADRVAVVLAALLVAGLYARFWQAPAPARLVEIRDAAGQVQRLPLSVDRELQVMGREGYSTIRIRGGRVRFVDSPCRNRICVHSGWHEHAGDAAACAPNGVSLRLVGDGGVDAVAE